MGPTRSAQVVKIFICPSDPLPNMVSTYTTGGVTYYFGMNSYLGNGGTRSWFPDFNYSVDGIFHLNSRTTISGIADGTSNTFLAGERYHKDPAYTNIETLGGWAWSNYQAVQDCIGSTRVPVNYLCPVGSNPNSFLVTDPRVAPSAAATPVARTLHSAMARSGSSHWRIPAICRRFRRSRRVLAARSRPRREQS